MPGRERSVISSLPAYRPGKAATQTDSGVAAIKLSSNENPYAPVAAVQSAVTDAVSGVNRYPDHRATALRETLADFVGVASNQVTVGNGSVGLLQQICLAYVDAGDEVVFPWRSFEAYPILAQLVGGRVVTSPLVDHAIDLDSLSVTPATKLVFLASPNNPTGTALSTTQIAKFLGRVSQDTIVVIDEAYKEFMDPALGDSVTDLLPQFANTVVLRTFSKTHGLAGLRAGYAIGHPDVIATIDKTLLPFAVSSVAQVAAIAAVGAIDEIKQRVEMIKAERQRVANELADWNIPQSEANFVYIPTGDETDRITAELESAGVIIRPFSGEGIRVTISSPEENNRFLEAFKK